MGVFPEQAPNWEFIYKETSRLSRIHKANGLPAPKVLNLFAYTGAASLAAKCAGADVTHLDSVRQVVSWARENMEKSGLDGILQNVSEILGERDSFMILNLYSNGYSAALGETVVREAFSGNLKEMTSGELALTDGFGKDLPLSIYVRIKR